MRQRTVVDAQQALADAFRRSTLAGPSPLTAENDRQTGKTPHRCDYCGGALAVGGWCLDCGRMPDD